MYNSNLFLVIVIAARPCFQSLKYLYGSPFSSLVHVWNMSLLLELQRIISFGFLHWPDIIAQKHLSKRMIQQLMWKEVKGKWWFIWFLFVISSYLIECVLLVLAIWAMFTRPVLHMNLSQSVLSLTSYVFTGLKAQSVLSLTSLVFSGLKGMICSHLSLLGGSPLICILWS